MAQGSHTVFHATAGYLRDKDVDIAGGTWKAALLTNPITSLLNSETNPALGSTNATEVTQGGGYTTKGIALTMANTDTGGVVTLKLNTSTHPSGKITWTSSASGDPDDIKSMIVYDDAATSPTDAAVIFFDMTADGGTTAISLLAGDVSFTFGSGGVAGAILTVTVT